MSEYAKSMEAESKIGKTTEYTWVSINTPIRNHPTLAAFCRRKRKRWIKRWAKIGIITFSTTKQIITE